MAIQTWGAPEALPDRICSGNTLAALQCALDLDTLWQAARGLLDDLLPLHSCSLMFGIADYEPRSARHHVVQAPHPDYEPATSLTVSQPYLNSHPQIKLYTYSQIVSEDPAAGVRRLAQESCVGAWAEFVHLAFWRGQQLEAVLSVRRGLDNPRFSHEEMNFLRQLYPMVDAALHRVHTLESERARHAQLERFLYNSSLPAMFVDAEGTLLFATAAAIRFHRRWSDDQSNGTSRDIAGFPTEIRALLQRARLQATIEGGEEDAETRSTPGLLARHPSIPGLSARVHVRWQVSHRGRAPVYVLTYSMSTCDPVGGRELSRNALLALQQLSPSERRVALLAAEGLRNQEISSRLNRSRRTIEFQLNSIYRKLDVNSRTQLTRLLT